MTKELDQNSIQALMNYRIQRAEETIPEAELLIKGGFYSASVNRLYFACYYAVTALLVKKRIPAHTHAGVKQMFNLHFIKSGLIEPGLGRFYNQIFNDRITGDYDDFLTWDLVTLEVLLNKTREFVQSVKNSLLSD